MASFGQTVTISYVAWNTSTNAGATGDVANHTLRWVKDGTSAAPTNAASEVDATNAPGVYKIVMTATECQCNVGTLGGKSSTANVVIIPTTISFEQLPTALDANGWVKADVEDWKGAAAPAMTGDAYAVANTRLPAALTANGNMKSSLVEILTTALTETAGYLAAAFKNFFNVGTPTGTVNSLPALAPSVIGGLPTVASGSTQGAIYLSSSGGGAVRASDTSGGVIASATNLAALSTTVGTPAGASVSADIAAIKTEEDAIKAKTDTLPASPAAVGSQMDLVNSPNATAIGAITAAMLLKPVPATGNTTNTVADCLNAARAQGFGKWVLNPGALTVTLYAPDKTTVVATFNIDSATAPLTRTPV